MATYEIQAEASNKIERKGLALTQAIGALKKLNSSARCSIFRNEVEVEHGTVAQALAGLETRAEYAGLS